MFEQIKLKYAFDALEPHIDTLTMETHYGKHHATYTKNLNDTIEKLPELKGKSIEEILSNLDAIPEELRTAVQNNGGGYYNHNLYFEILSPNGGGEPTGKLAEKIKADFGSFDKLKEEISAKAAGRFGSGWAWLVATADGHLKVVSSPNQDNPFMCKCENKGQPILALDVWEHAYYLKYKNVRADYIKAFFDVVDWNEVAKKYEEAIG
ncbi:superoxide dismutase [Sebaldella sp. S0638]|uniref:superoxide dismutase n=1 Tax=Sebaldella sp. S0638 TaxID=2957809 RepID=UPI0020A1243F|nr:superoxide dismutase [Sebaldella sp. S0638]MCP1223468.1 superoxide dismutase [Sebaldella sp. S0638]